MPRTIRTLAAAVALVLALASCSVVENLVPPQQVSDPLGLHDVPVTLEPMPAPAGAGAQATTRQAVARQATATYGATFGPASVPDIDTSGIPAWFDPDSLRIDVGIMPTVVLESVVAADESEFSETFVLNGAALADFSIVDDDGEPRVDLDPIATPAPASVTLARQGCSGVVTLTCTYAAQSGLDAFVIPVVVEHAAMDRLYTIITGGASTNTASGSLRLTATGTAPSGTTVTITLDAPTGTLDP